MLGGVSGIKKVPLAGEKFIFSPQAAMEIIAAAKSIRRIACFFMVISNYTQSTTSLQ